MYAINKIFTAMGIEPLSYLEELQDDQGIDLIKLRKTSHMHAYYLTLLFYPKSLIYRRDIEYVEGIFELCGSLVLNSYITLLKYYAMVVQLAPKYSVQFNIGIALDIFSSTEDITAITTVEKNTALKIRVIKLPLSTLSDKTLLNYAVNPQKLIMDVLNKGKVRFVVNRNESNSLIFNDRAYLIYLISCEEINEYFHYPYGYVIGTSLISDDMVCVCIQESVCILYINDNILYSVNTDLNNIIAQDSDVSYRLYQLRNQSSRDNNLTDFLDSLRGYVKMFIDQDVYNTVINLVQSDNKTEMMIKEITNDNSKIITNKLYDYLDKIIETKGEQS